MKCQEIDLAMMRVWHWKFENIAKRNWVIIKKKRLDLSCHCIRIVNIVIMSALMSVFNLETDAVYEQQQQKSHYIQYKNDMSKAFLQELLRKD